MDDTINMDIQSKGPLELSEHIQLERKRIADELNAMQNANPRVPWAGYAQAHKELDKLALWAALEVAKLDPSADLAPVQMELPMTYDEIITREA